MFAIFAVLLILSCVLIRPTTALAANVIALPSYNDTLDILTFDFLDQKDDPPPKGRIPPGEGPHHFTLPKTEISIHIQFPLDPPPLPLDYNETLTCLHTFCQQLGLFRDAYIDRSRYVVYNDIKVTLAPVKTPHSKVTFKTARKLIAGLWFYLRTEKLLWECKFAAFDKGTMVAWGMLEFRDEPWPPVEPRPVPTAVE